MELSEDIKQWDDVNKKILLKLSGIDNCDLSESIIEWNISLAKKDYKTAKLIFMEFSQIISLYKEISFNVNNEIYDNIVYSHNTRDLIIILMELCNNFKELNLYIQNTIQNIEKEKYFELKKKILKEISNLKIKTELELIPLYEKWNEYNKEKLEIEYKLQPNYFVKNLLENQLIPYSNTIYFLGLFIYNEITLSETPMLFNSIRTVIGKFLGGICLLIQTNEYIGFNINKIITKLALYLSLFIIKIIETILPIKFSNILYQISTNKIIEMIFIFIYYYLLNYINNLYKITCKILTLGISIINKEFINSIYKDILDIMYNYGKDVYLNLGVGFVKMIASNADFIWELFTEHIYNIFINLITLKNPNIKPSETFLNSLEKNNIISFSSDEKKLLLNGEITFGEVVNEKIQLTLDSNEQIEDNMDNKLIIIQNFEKMINPTFFTTIYNALDNNIQNDMSKIGILNIYNEMNNSTTKYKISIDTILSTNYTSNLEDSDYALIKTSEYIIYFYLMYFIFNIFKKKFRN